MRFWGVVGPGDFALAAFGGEDSEGDFCGAGELGRAGAEEGIGGGAFEGDDAVFDGGVAIAGFPALEFFAEWIVFSGLLFLSSDFANADEFGLILVYP